MFQSITKVSISSLSLIYKNAEQKYIFCAEKKASMRGNCRYYYSNCNVKQVALRIAET